MGTMILCRAIATILIISMTTANVTFHVEDTYTFNNTEVFQQGLSCTFPEDEADSAVIGWKDSSRYPQLQHFYEITDIATGNTIISKSITWNGARSDEERKEANGTMLFSVYKGMSFKDSKDIVIFVNWKPGGIALLSRSPASGDIIRDKTLKLTCSGDRGNPTGSVTWKINGTEMTDDMYKTDIITINAAQAEHDGDWSCYFTNDLGSGNESAIQIVEVKWKPEKPSIIFTPDVSLLNIGQPVKLTCQLKDKGNPEGKVVWLENGRQLNESDYRDAALEFVFNRTHNGSKWCCYYGNGVGIGQSGCGTVILTSTIPIPGALMVTNRTAQSLNISIDNSGIYLDTYHSMNVSWRSNTSMEAVYEIVHSNITYKLFSGLEPETYYTMQFAFVHDGETDRYREISDSTEYSPVSDDPVLMRDWLSARCKLNLADPDSDKIVVCKVCRPDGTNCISKKKTFPAKQVTKRSTAEEEVIILVKDNSFSRRLVNVTVYDTGVLVYDYSDSIDAPVAAIILIVLGAVLIVALIIIIIVIIIKKTGKGKQKPRKEVEEEISPYGHTNTAMNNESRTGTGHATKAENQFLRETKPRKLPSLDNTAPPVISVVNKGKPLAPIAASPADGDVYSQVDWSKKTKRPSLKGLPMSKKAIDKITFSKKDGSINMHLEVSKKFTGEIGIDVCRDGDQSSKSKKSKQHVGGTKNVVMVLPIEDTSQDNFTIRMKFIAKGQMVQEVDLTYPYEQNAVHVTVMNDAYVTSGTDVKASEMPEYSEVNKSKKTKGSEMPIYSEVNKPKKKKKAAEEQPYEDVETKNQSSNNERSTNAVSPSNAEVAVEGVPPHPPRKGAPKEGVMYAELDLNSSGAPRLLPRLGSKSPAQEPVIYADVRPGQKDVV